jgi:tRNA pseudouridine55 synthase
MKLIRLKTPMKRTDSARAVNGILLLNKPQGPSSNAVLQQVRRFYHAKKAGHTGSLDPLATGMLPICFGEGTKFCQYLLDADKVYQASALLGIKTDTGDALGQVIKETHDFFVSESELLAALAKYSGPIKQIPSMFSALKHKGVPLYKYAREGINLARPARDIIIHKLWLSYFDGRRFDIEVSCSKGTYIRNLIEDIGDYLGVGAHVTGLHRLHTAGFEKDKMFSVPELQAKSDSELLDCLLPVERVVNHLAAIHLTGLEVQVLQQGKVLNKELQHVEGCVRLYDERGHFLGVGDYLPEKVLKVKRLLSMPL